MPECLGYGMSFADFYSCDHGEIGMFLKGNRDREERAFKAELAISVRSATMLGNKILLGLNGKPYNSIREDFPELFDKERGKKQTWQEQEAIFRRFLKLP